MWERLPIEIVKIILSYDGTIIKERNGKFIKQISKTDDRYEKLLKVPTKEIYCRGQHAEVHFLRFAQENNKKFVFSMNMTEFFDCIRFVFCKNGGPIDETRFIIR
jgi:hypothetical protein